MYKIPFNKPHLTGKELEYMSEAVSSGKISGDGQFTFKCHQYFENVLGFQKCLLTTSCTDALEMCAILLNITEGDEVIVPSFTFVSTANPFVLRGATIKFCDSSEIDPNIDVSKIEELISPKTKAIVIVHYAGVACDMEAVMRIAKKHSIHVVEDAAQAIDAYYQGKRLGSFGTFGTFSFHETKNIQAGEGGMLVINDPSFISRSEIIREKGTNRSAFFRNEVDKYGWVDIGSSFLPSDLIAAFLFAQLENLEKIQNKRKHIWNLYWDGLCELVNTNLIKLPFIPQYASNNAHMFYILVDNVGLRTKLINYLKERGVLSVFHYISLHSSFFYSKKYDGRELVNSDRYTNSLLRLPLYADMSDEDVHSVINSIKEFFKNEDLKNA